MEIPVTRKRERVSRTLTVFSHQWWNSQHHVMSCHQTPLTPTAFSLINHEYSEYSQNSRTSVGTPDLKIRLDLHLNNAHASTAIGLTANSTSVFKTCCILHKVACMSFCNVHVNAVRTPSI